MDPTRKSRYCSGGNITNPPSSMKYASIVRREIVIISFLIDTLNYISIISGNIQNSYLNAQKFSYIQVINRILTKGNYYSLLGLYML